MFIVLEGIDGAGKGRQREEISLILKNKFKELISVEFPDHKGVMYRELIKPALLEKIAIDNKALFLAFALDQLFYQKQITEAKGSNANTFICDGYFTTNLVYNCLVNSVIGIDEAIKFATEFGIMEADLNIFIDVDPKVALERKMHEPGHDEGLDINERDLEKQYKIRDGYLFLAKNKIFGKWEIIPGNGSIAEVKNNLISTLIKNKYIKNG